MVTGMRWTCWKRQGTLTNNGNKDCHRPARNQLDETQQLTTLEERIARMSDLKASGRGGTGV